MDSDGDERLRKLQEESERLDARKRSVLGALESQSAPRELASLQSPRKPPKKTASASPSPRKTDPQSVSEPSVDQADEVASRELKGESLERFLKAQLSVARRDVARLEAELAASEKRALAAEERAAQLTAAAKELQNVSGGASAKAERAEKARAAAVQRCEALEAEASSLKSAVDSGAKAARQSQREAAAAETRARAAEGEVDRLRAELDGALQRQEERDQLRALCDKLQQEVKAMAQQRANLVAAYTTQTRLVDVLRRQKAHLESAKLLQISEQEFARLVGSAASSDV